MKIEYEPKIPTGDDLHMNFKGISFFFPIIISVCVAIYALLYMQWKSLSFFCTMILVAGYACRLIFGSNEPQKVQRFTKLTLEPRALLHR